VQLIAMVKKFLVIGILNTSCVAFFCKPHRGFIISNMEVNRFFSYFRDKLIG
jgi:hypothetical protein